MIPELFTELQEKINGVLDRQVFFIVGAQKSGTTWLQTMLDNHPEILCGGEGHFIDKLGKFLIDALRPYNNLMELVNERVYEGKPYYTPFTYNEYNYCLLSLMALIMAKRDVLDTIRCIGDKTPATSLHMKEIFTILPQVKFVHIVRDGRDALVSNLLHAQRIAEKHGVKGKKPFTFDNYADDFGKKWANHVAKVMAFEQNHPEHCYTVTYESLKQDPENALKPVLKFLGVSTSKKNIQHCIESASFEVMSGGRKAGEEDTQSFVRKGIVGDWKNHLSDKHLAAFNDYGAHLLKHYGYDVN